MTRGLAIVLRLMRAFELATSNGCLIQLANPIIRESESLRGTNERRLRPVVAMGRKTA
jgi:hypothetical protein